MPSPDHTLQDDLNILREKHRFRERSISTPLEGAYIERDGAKYLSFSSNDYFGLSAHPEIMALSGRYGAGASALVTGYHPALASLEAKLASMKGTQAALVFGSGYLANIGTIASLVDKCDLIIADKRIHACMLDGAVLSGATLKRFRHNDVAHAKTLLKARTDFRRCLILTETIFSMDGDCAPLTALKALAQEHDAWLMTDDAHGLGIIDSHVADIQMGTLSKGAGAYGGYVCGSQLLIESLVNSARSYIFTTALPPSICMAAEAGLTMIEQDKERTSKPVRLAQQFCEKLGLPSPQSPIVPLIIGSDEAALSASAQLAEQGFWVSAIRPPTVAEGEARLRFTFTALHESGDINRLCEAIKTHGWHEDSHA